MKPYYQDDTVTLYQGDCRDVLPGLSGITAVATDPPYGLNFMSTAWDHGVPGAAFWQAVAGACLPGAPLLAFGGTRTFHRLACAIEDAGWDLRDTMCWLHAQGFPKNLDISKAIDKAAGYDVSRDGYIPNGKNNTHGCGWGGGHKTTTPSATTDAARRWHGYGTALAPAFEPIVLAMNPRAGTFAQNAVEHGTGGLNIEGTRVGAPLEYSSGGFPERVNRPPRDGREEPNGRTWARSGPGVPKRTVSGRWPPNVLLTHDADCTGDACAEACPVRMLDEQSGVRQGREPGPMHRGKESGTGIGGQGRYNTSCPQQLASVGYGDVGGASRFFPRFRYEAKASRADRGPGNTWPTVKPQALMRWLLTLVRQPGTNLILDPFAGSGTTGVAAKTLGLPCILIDASEAACEIAARRLSATTPSLFQSEPTPPEPAPAPVQTRLDL